MKPEKGGGTTQCLYAEIFKHPYTTVQLKTCSIISLRENAFSDFGSKRWKTYQERH